MYNLRYVSDNGAEIILTRDYGYLVNTVDGATGRTVNVLTAQSYGQIGDTLQGMSVGGQIITIHGRIPHRNTTAKRAMLRTFLPLSTGRLIWNERYYIDVCVHDSPSISQEKHSVFMLSLYAPYPYWQRLDQSYYELGGLTAQFRFPINYATPHRFGTSVSGTQFNAINNGDSAVRFALTILAGASDLTDFAITNVNTLKSLKFTGTLYAGDRLEMYRESGQLYLRRNGTEDAFDLLDDTSDLFDLDAGDNVLLFTADAGADDAKVAITFNESYVGVLADGV